MQYLNILVGGHTPSICTPPPCQISSLPTTDIVSAHLVVTSLMPPFPLSCSYHSRKPGRGLSCSGTNIGFRVPFNVKFPSAKCFWHLKMPKGWMQARRSQSRGQSDELLHGWSEAVSTHQSLSFAATLSWPREMLLQLAVSKVTLSRIYFSHWNSKTFSETRFNQSLAFKYRVVAAYFQELTIWFI